jgi:hypothetical protein
MAKMTEDDLEVIANLLEQREKEFIKITDKRLDEYYEYYKQVRKISNATMMFSGGIFVMSVILAYIGLDIFLAIR